MTTERTPLISRASDGPEQADQSQPHTETSAATSLHGIQSKDHSTRRYRWPSLVALLALCVIAVLIIVFAFIAPSALEQYAAAAVVFAPTSLSIDSFTKSGVRTRVQGHVEMDASRVQSSSVRNVGRFCTWVAREAETGESEVQVSLPDYGNVLVGTARIPGIRVNVRNGHSTPVDFFVDLRPGNVDGIKTIANDWIQGRLRRLRVVGRASVPVKSGLISLGKQFLEKEMIFADSDIPSIPAYDIQNLSFREIDFPKGKGMAADVSLQVANHYPVSFTLPPLAFRILVDNCAEDDDPYIQVAHALTKDVSISPLHPVVINVTGTLRKLPSSLTKTCPDSTNSPLDNLVEGYLHSRPTTIYLRGSDSPSKDTPEWISSLMSHWTIPVPVPGGREMPGNLIRNFSFEDTHFSLPDPWATPGTPKSNPRITANVHALIRLPEELESVPLNVSKVRADADVFYKKRKLGRLDLNPWQPASSQHVKYRKDELQISARVKDAPLDIQNQEVFEEVMEELIFGQGLVVLEIEAKVDVGVEVGALGEVVVRGVEVEGRVPVKRPANIPAPGHNGAGNLTNHLRPALTNLRITNTTARSLSLELTLNITNPTPYSARIPYVDVHLEKNASLLGHATARNVTIVPGRNAGVVIGAVWEPYDGEGESGGSVGRELISEYISGYENLTLGISMHEGSFPSNPTLGRALQRWKLEVPLPNLSSRPSSSSSSDGHDDDDDDENQGPRFLKDAKMHLLTSTATFVLLSPLRTETLWIDRLNATAFYDGQPAGGILYEEPMGVLPIDRSDGAQGWETPRLPVTWRVGSVGYGAVRKALGGRLKLGAYADVRVRVGEWREAVWFRGKGLGVHIGL